MSASMKLYTVSISPGTLPQLIDRHVKTLCSLSHDSSHLQRPWRSSVGRASQLSSSRKAKAVKFSQARSPVCLSIYLFLGCSLCHAVFFAPSSSNCPDGSAELPNYWSLLKPRRSLITHSLITRRRPLGPRDIPRTRPFATQLRKRRPRNSTVAIAHPPHEIRRAALQIAQPCSACGDIASFSSSLSLPYLRSTSLGRQVRHGGKLRRARLGG